MCAVLDEMVVKEPPLPVGLARLVAREARQIQLTRREHSVLRCAVMGLKRSDIAAALGINDGTVKCHVRAISKKAGRPRLRVLVHEILLRGYGQPKPVRR